MSAREIQSALRRLVSTDDGYQTLEGLPEVGAQTGGVVVGQAGRAGGGGVAFEEDDYLQREYWAVRTITTSDGLFSWEERPIKSILLVGGSRALFAEPIDP